MFAIPYEHEFTLIGTTDVEHHGQPQDLQISQGEIDYLCATVNRYFSHQTSARDVIHSFSGVRPLLEDEVVRPGEGDARLCSGDGYAAGAAADRLRRQDHHLHALAEEAVDQLCAVLQVAAAPWTQLAVLPGGDLPGASLAAFLRAVARRYAWLPAAVRERYARAYGTRMGNVIGAARSLSMMGEEVLRGLYEREIDYLCSYEWATCAHDILWRRSKLGLHLPAGSEAHLDAWLTARGQARS